MFVFRNHTVERFFPKGYTFSGYDDISFIPRWSTSWGGLTRRKRLSP